jgi:hypothetical protein
MSYSSTIYTKGLLDEVGYYGKNTFFVYLVLMSIDITVYSV